MNIRPIIEIQSLNGVFLIMIEDLFHQYETDYYFIFTTRFLSTCELL